MSAIRRGTTRKGISLEWDVEEGEPDEVRVVTENPDVPDDLRNTAFAKNDGHAGVWVPADYEGEFDAWREDRDGNMVGEVARIKA